MKSFPKISLTLTILLLVFSGCTKNITEFNPLASRLNSAIQGVCERPDIYGFPENGTTETLLNLATEDDPALLTPFKDMTLQSQCVKHNAVLMVCDSDGKFKLIEDCGSTAKLEKYYSLEEEAPCEFSNPPLAICSQLEE